MDKKLIFNRLEGNLFYNDFALTIVFVVMDKKSRILELTKIRDDASSLLNSPRFYLHLYNHFCNLPIGKPNKITAIWQMCY
jgi:hypothetical protein